jgi:aquaporin Z
MARAEADRTASHLDHELVAFLNDFEDPSQEWRRLFSELLGTFFLVLVAAGGGIDLPPLKWSCLKYGFDHGG